ncbi:DMT family transporter [Hyphomonas sp.]|uniref:DMT family transporter n=1 Tax=Hyphomonas sp. TaxID=87 RepID=UPI001D3CFEBC|nr:DMT family transporter [Hyphomonas sp.]MBU3922570.1 DMT family transporter [Alphaproteobacteria bacterium]MBU4061700.1 DMT family transporter [Alphaproteobacteria bacterium]MBU4163545.1 DMT family transporter [Alphaproteobacteria bacterium]
MNNNPSPTAPSSIRRRPLSGNLQGALWMIVSGAGYTLHLALAKDITADIHPIFLAFWRSFLAFAFCTPFILLGRVRLHTHRFGALVTRSLIGSAGFVFGLIAIWPKFDLPLAEFNALSFTRPLFVTLLAVLLLHEKVGPHRTTAVIAGFCGVLVMTLVPALLGSDGGTHFNLGSLFAILSSLCFAFTIVLVKSLTGVHSPLALLIWANLLSSIFILPAALAVWAAPSLTEWIQIAGMAFFGVVAQFCFIKGMSVGDASFLSPMDYLRLPMGATADWVMIRALPGVFVWAGAGIIVVSTLYITWREHVLNRVKPVEPPKLF